MVKKRTTVDEATEREALQVEALHLIRSLVATPLGTQAEQTTVRKMRFLAGRIANRERQDRCYYCGAYKKQLACEDTGVCQCIDCAGDAYAFRLQTTRALHERLNTGYFL